MADALYFAPWIAGAALAGTLAALAWIDWRTGYLPDRLTLPLLAAGLLYTSWSAGLAGFAEGLLGAGVGYSAFVALEKSYKALRGVDGLGRGDAKLLAAGGAWCGWAALPLIVLTASLLGLGFVGASAALRRRGVASTQAIAFGPHIAAAILAVWITTQSAVYGRIYP